MNYQCIIINEDPICVLQLTDCINENAKLKLTESFKSLKAALLAIKLKEPPSLIFVDQKYLKEPKIALSLKEMGRYIIATSTQPEDAVIAYDLDIDDFLLMPLNAKRLELSVSKMICKRSKDPEDYFLTKPTREKPTVEKCFYKDIVLIESDQNYIKIYTLKKVHQFRYSLTDLENELKGKNEFIRIHRSFIISTLFIEYINGRKIKMVNKKGVIIVREKYNKQFINFTKNKSLKFK